MGNSPSRTTNGLGLQQRGLGRSVGSGGGKGRNRKDVSVEWEGRNGDFCSGKRGCVWMRKQGRKATDLWVISFMSVSSNDNRSRRCVKKCRRSYRRE